MIWALFTWHCLGILVMTVTKATADILQLDFSDKFKTVLVVGCIPVIMLIVVLVIYFAEKTEEI